MRIFSADAKDQIISKGLLVSSNSPKKRTNKFVFTTTTNSFVHFLGEFEDVKKSFWNYLTFTDLYKIEIRIRKQDLPNLPTDSTKKLPMVGG